MQLDRHVAPERLLTDTLQLLVEVSGAALAYLELAGKDEPAYTACAIDDARFDAARRRDQIQAVLRVPIADPIAGSISLHGHPATLLVDDQTRAMVQLLANEVAKVAPRLLDPSKRTLHDLANEYKKRVIAQALERHAGNASAAADELGIDRATVYRVKARDSED